MSNPDMVELEQRTDTALRRGLQTEPLSADAMQRIRAATEAEWRDASQSPAHARSWRRLAGIAAAALLAISGSLFYVLGTSGHAAIVTGRLERADYPGAVEQRRWSSDHVLADGEPVHAGQKILARGGARIALPGSGSLRVAAGTVVEFVSAQAIRLSDGSIYLDFPPAPGAHVDYSVATAAGTFTHVGTQFQLSVRDGGTVLQVREGQVRWHSASGDVVTDAGTQLSINSNGKVTRSALIASGPNWTWAESLAETFEIDGRTLADFLHRSARETGRTLIFADGEAEQRANRTILHGSMRDLAALDALSAVMATTTLRFTIGTDSIRIQSGGDPEQNSR